MSKAKTVKETLIAAKWILENVGWCQNSYYQNHRGQVCASHAAAYACASGAIMLVEVSDPTLINRTIHFLRHTLGFTDKINGNVAYWNDLPGRTKEEVIQLFDKAIKKAE